MSPCRRPTLAILLLSLTGCDLSPSPTDLALPAAYLGVHAVLEAGATSAEVLVTRTGPLPGSSTLGVWPEPGAVVWLVSEATGDSVRLPPGGSASCVTSPHPDPSLPSALEAGCYAAEVPAGIEPGQVFRLRVTVGDVVVTGQTVVPTYPMVTSAAAEDTLSTGGWTGGRSVPADSATVQWAVHGSAQHAELRIVPQRAECFTPVRRSADDPGQPFLTVTGEPRVTVVPMGLDCGGAEAGAEPAMVQVTVGNEAYGRYYREHRDRSEDSVTRDHASVGLTGAYGVFGAVASAGVRVFLRPIQRP